MAPTEVLAEQLYSVATAMLSDLAVPSEGTLLAERPVTVALLTNRVGAAERRKIAAGLGGGRDRRRRRHPRAALRRRTRSRSSGSP